MNQHTTQGNRLSEFKRAWRACGLKLPAPGQLVGWSENRFTLEFTHNERGELRAVPVGGERVLHVA